VATVAKTAPKAADPNWQAIKPDVQFYQNRTGRVDFDRRDISSGRDNGRRIIPHDPEERGVFAFIGMTLQPLCVRWAFIGDVTALAAGP